MNKEEFEHLDWIAFTLRRPDTNLGSIETKRTRIWLPYSVVRGLLPKGLVDIDAADRAYYSEDDLKTWVPLSKTSDPMEDVTSEDDEGDKSEDENKKGDVDDGDEKKRKTAVRFRMVPLYAMVNPGVIKLIDELIGNAEDNLNRDRTMSYIHATLNQKEGVFSIENDGVCIPVTKGVEGFDGYLPTQCFTVPNTGSNFDDSNKKRQYVRGRNGYGAKLTMAFSEEAEIECSHVESGKTLRQAFRKNLSQIDKPRITSYKGETGKVKVTTKLELSRFGFVAGQGFDDIHAACIEMMVRELVPKMPEWVTVKFNGKKVGGLELEEYAKAAMTPAERIKGVNGELAVQEVITGNLDQVPVAFQGEANAKKFPLWKIVVGVSPTQKTESLCFVNGGRCDAGTHVEEVLSKTAAKIQRRIKAGKVDMGRVAQQWKDRMTASFIRKHLFLVGNFLIPYPKFDSQKKSVLETKPNAFGVEFTPSDVLCETLEKSAGLSKMLVASIKAEVAGKGSDNMEAVMEAAGMAANDRERGRILAAKGVNEARNACKKNRGEEEKAVMILTEGDSGKTLILSGVPNRDEYGAYGLGGKVLEVRGATKEQIKNNVEICTIIKISGLIPHKMYASYDELMADARYTEWWVAADQDADGDHIWNGIINIFDYFWPTLLEIAPDFIKRMETPIVQIHLGHGKEPIWFFHEMEAKKFLQDNQGKFTSEQVKRYKGLGSSNEKDAVRYFKNLDKLVVRLRTRAEIQDPVTEESIREQELIHKCFSKDNVEWRKGYLKQLDIMAIPPSTIGKDGRRVMTFEHNLKYHLGPYWNLSNARSIPCFIDGKKPSQRKVLHIIMTRYHSREARVSEIGSKVVECDAYHHGDAAVNETITYEAQHHPGTNNIHFLLPNGMFGSKMENRGNGHGQYRYIFAKMHHIITRATFPKEDDPILDYVIDDEKNKFIEPFFYVPVLSTLAINGTAGTGTGYSTFIPPHNPKQVLEITRMYLNRLMELQDGEDDEDLEQLVQYSHTPEIFKQLANEDAIEHDEWMPWWWGFSGTIEKRTKTGISTHQACGVAELEDGGKTVHITELPPCTFANPYKDMIAASIGIEIKNSSDKKGPSKAPRKGQWISSHVVGMEEANRKNIADIRVTLKEPLKELTEKEFDGLQLIEPISYNNMNVMNHLGNVVTLPNIDALIVAHAKMRYRFYARRKLNIIHVLRYEIKVADNKARYIKLVNDGTLDIRRCDEEEKEKEMEKLGLERLPARCPKLKLPTLNAESRIVMEDEDSGSEEEDENKGKKKQEEEKKGKRDTPSFLYLWEMQQRSLTAAREKALYAEVKQKKEQLHAFKAEKLLDTWKTELDKFEIALGQYMTHRHQAVFVEDENTEYNDKGKVVSRKRRTKAKTKHEDDNGDEEGETAKPVAKKRKPSTAPKVSKKPAPAVTISLEDEDDKEEIILEDTDDDEEDIAPPKKAAKKVASVAAAKKKARVLDSDDDE